MSAEVLREAALGLMHEADEGQANGPFLKAVANWLEFTADRTDTSDPGSLAVARAYLGETS